VKACVLILFRLESVHEAVKGKMVLALHGTTGLSDDLLRECISKGVRKVNVNKVRDISLKPCADPAGAPRRVVWKNCYDSILTPCSVC
jgi:hypothetical protein